MGNREIFKENGYCIIPNVYSESDMGEMFYLFLDVFKSIAHKNKIQLSHPINTIAELKYPADLKILDHLILDVFNYSKDLVGEGYDIVSYSGTFMRFLSNKKIEAITRELLGLPEHAALYGWTNRVRIDPPADERRTYGWHQEVFYTIPESRYLQTWCPVLRDTTSQNGTIHVCPASHKEGVAKQSWNEIPGRATQIIIDQDLVNKYQNVVLEMKVGDVLFFDGHLFHQSGHNATKDEIRFSMVGMWNDISNESFRGPKPSFTQRTTLDAKEYWKEYNKRLGWGFEEL